MTPASSPTLHAFSRAIARAAMARTASDVCKKTAAGAMGMEASDYFKCQIWFADSFVREG